MNTVITSRDAILEVSRRLVVEQGWTAVNMRSVAGACGVAVGSLYNYFGSKSELVMATVESVWREAFHLPGQTAPPDGFLECVEWLFQSIEKAGRKYPGFFTLHSMSFVGEDKEKGRRLMEQSWEHIQGSLRAVLERDTRLRPGAFDERFTPEDLVSLVFSLIVSSLLEENPRRGPILELIRRCIY